MNKHIKKQLIERDKRLYYDFLPDMEGIIEKPANVLTTILLFTCFVLIISTIIWACRCKLDITIIATGNVDTVEALVTPVYMASGIIDEVLVKDGDYVEVGTVICRLDSSQKELSLQEVKYNLELLVVQKEIYGALYDMYKSGEISSLNVDLSSYKKFEKVVESIILENDMFIQDLKELSHEKKQRALEEQLYSVTNNINKIDAQIEKVKLQIESLEKDLENMTVKATVPGYITYVEKMYVGKIVNVGNPVCYINELENDYIFTTYIADEDITSISVGDSVSIKLPGYEDTEYEYIDGTVVSISNIPINKEEKGVTYMVRISADVIPQNIKSGMEGVLDVVVGKRTVMDYFLEPFKNGLSDSLNER